MATDLNRINVLINELNNVLKKYGLGVDEYRIMSDHSQIKVIPLIIRKPKGLIIEKE